MIEMTIKARVYPTESEFTVKKVLRNIYNFPDDSYSLIEQENELYQIIEVNITGIDILEELFRGIRRQKIVQAFREMLEQNIDVENNLVNFMLHKQALAVPSFHLCEDPTESPLGPVEVTLRSDDIVELINYLSPNTINGEVQELHYTPER